MLLLCGDALGKITAQQQQHNLLDCSVADAIMLKWPMAKCPLVESYVEQLTVGAPESITGGLAHLSSCISMEVTLAEEVAKMVPELKFIYESATHLHSFRRQIECTMITFPFSAGASSLSSNRPTPE